MLTTDTQQELQEFTTALTSMVDDTRTTFNQVDDYLCSNVGLYFPLPELTDKQLREIENTEKSLHADRIRRPQPRQFVPKIIRQYRRQARG